MRRRKHHKMSHEGNKFWVHPLDGGPQAFAKAKTYASEDLVVSDNAVIPGSLSINIDVSEYFWGVVTALGTQDGFLNPIYAKLRVYHSSSNSQISFSGNEGFLILKDTLDDPNYELDGDENTQYSTSYILNVQSIENIYAELLDQGLELTFTPIQYEDFIRRGSTVPLQGTGGLSIKSTQGAEINAVGGIAAIVSSQSSLDAVAGIFANDAQKATLSGQSKLQALSAGTTLLDAQGGIFAIVSSQSKIDGQSGISAIVASSSSLSSTAGLSASASVV